MSIKQNRFSDGENPGHAFAVSIRELKQGLCDRLKGGVGRETGGMSGRKGIWVYLWLILVDV